MPTTPFSDDLVDKLKGATAWRFDSKLGPVFTPRFFCCTDPNALGISDGKEPVAIIQLSPSPAFTNETVDYDGTLSYDPDGSITGYAWTFESHTPTSGTANSGTLNYSTSGTYTIELVVTDGTGLKSSPARTELVVVDPAFMGYVATSSGVFYSDGTNPVTWIDKNSGLSGDDLVANWVAIDPATQTLPEASKTVWRSTDGGIQVSNDGGASWTEKNPSTIPNDQGDSPAPTVSDVSFQQLHFVGDRLFVIGTWANGSGDERSAIFYTDNAPDVRSDTSATVTWSNV
jgi:hypothetical protein